MTHATLLESVATTLLTTALLTTTLFAPLSSATETAADFDVRRTAPPEAHIAVYVQKNPERDAHASHWKDVFDAVEREQIGPRLLEVVTSRMAEDDLAQADAALGQLQRAVSSTSLAAIADAEQVMYAQVMQFPVTQHLLVIRMPGDGAAGLAEAFEQLFRVIESWSDGKATVHTTTAGDAELATLETPPGVNVRPAVARLDNLVFISTQEQLVLDGLARLLNGQARSKFDDPRLKEALAHLPPPEDAIVFYDGKQLFEQMGELEQMIRANSRNDEKAERAIQAIQTVIHAVDIIDYEVTVEYTEGFQQRTAALGQFTSDAKEKMLHQALEQGEPFEDWEQWIPADATAYTLHSGISLSVVYQWTEQFLREQFPETHDTLQRWEAWQDEIDFHLKKDLLDNFPGGCVSVSLLLEEEEGGAKPHQVLAFRTTDGQGALELIERGIEAANHLPVIQTQGLRMVECPELDGFWELQANVFPMLGIRPVFGLEGQWLVFSDSPQAIAHVRRVREGEAESILDSQPWERLNMDVSGKVSAVRYTDVGATVERAAQMVEKIGVFAPVAVGMAGAQADPEVVAAVNEVLAVLPSLAKVIRELDFFQDSLSITQPGPLENSYRTDWVLQLESVD